MNMRRITVHCLLALTSGLVGYANAEQFDQARVSSVSPASGMAEHFLHSDAPFRWNFGDSEHASFVQFYGVVDLALAQTNHSLKANYQLPVNFYPYAGAPVSERSSRRTSWINGGLQGSRFGVRGEFGLMQHDADNIKLKYQFEGGFNPLDMSLNDSAQTLADNSGNHANRSVSADTSLNGEFFARQAWVGLDGGKIGRLSYGTQYNPFFDIFAAYDPNGKADTFSPFGESGAVGGGGGISENARMKHSVKYANDFKLNQDASIGLGAMFQAGNAAGFAHGDGMAAHIGFENSQFGIQVAWNKFTDAVRAGVASPGNILANDTIAASLFNTESTLLALRWFPRKDLKIFGGWEWYQLKPASDSELRYTHIFDQAVFGGVVKSGLAPGYKQNNNVYFIGAKYEFAEQVPILSGLSASLGFYDTKFDAIQGPTASTSSQGEIDTYTGILDYVLNKRFDTYVAFTSNTFKGDRYSSAAFHHQVSTVGAGLRMRF